MVSQLGAKGISLGDDDHVMSICPLISPHPFVKNLFWLVVDLPLWKILYSQLGWLFPIYGKIKVMFQSPPNTVFQTIPGNEDSILNTWALIRGSRKAELRFWKGWGPGIVLFHANLTGFHCYEFGSTKHANSCQLPMYRIQPPGDPELSKIDPIFAQNRYNQSNPTKLW